MVNWIVFDNILLVIWRLKAWHLAPGGSAFLFFLETARRRSLSELLLW